MAFNRHKTAHPLVTKFCRNIVIFWNKMRLAPSASFRVTRGRQRDECEKLLLRFQSIESSLCLSYDRIVHFVEPIHLIPNIRGIPL